MRRLRPFLLSLVVLLALLGCSSAANTQDLLIHFIDVGQGDAVLIQSPSGQNVLYDGGDRNTRALDYLRSIGIETLDLVIASHNHADHIGGLIPVVEHYRPRFFMENGIPHTTRAYEDLLLAVERAGSQVLGPTGQRIGLGEAALQILSPPGIESWGHDDNSIGVIIQYGSFRADLTGDAQQRLFQWWHENHPELVEPVQVYKSSHHGSHNGDTELSMRMFNPDVVVIGVGIDNRYGHPREEALALYDSVGATVYRTDLHGTVVITATLEGDYQVVTERGAPHEAEARAPPTPQPSASTPEPPASPAHCIDINTASRERLQGIIHIGEARLGEMLQLRQQRPFSSVDDMTRISGIGPARLRDIQAQGLACVNP